MQLHLLLYLCRLVPHPPPQPELAPAGLMRRSGSFEFPNAAAAQAAGVSSPVAIGRPVQGATTPAKTPATASKKKASPAKGSLAGNGSPASKASPAKAAAATADEPLASPARPAAAAPATTEDAGEADNVCSVQPRAAGRLSAASFAAGVVRAGEASLPGEGSLAATRPRRSQRKAVAADT